MSAMTRETSKKVKKQSPIAEKAIEHYIGISEQLNVASHNHVLAAKRQEAQQKLRSTGLPTRRDEEWQYTPLNAWMQIPFAKKRPGYLEPEFFKAQLPVFDDVLLVFVDGYFADDLSSDFVFLPEGLSVDLGETTNGALANSDEAFEVLHDMLSDKQLKIRVAQNTVLEKPIHLMCLQTQNEHITTRSVQLQVDENAEVTLVQHLVSLNQEITSFVNSFTQIQLAENAVCKQFVVQELNQNSFYFGSQSIQQEKTSFFNSLYVGLGSQVARFQGRLYLNGEYADANQNSIVLANNQQTLDSRTETSHVAPHCTSNQLHKFVLEDAARGVFNGMIYVDQKAQKTDGQMDNKNLLLSDKAKIDSKPQLEIYADDVKCSHGCATGEIDENQIFYCQARGIKQEAARQLITQAFLLEPLEEVTNEDIRHWLTGLVTQKLSQ